MPLASRSVLASRLHGRGPEQGALTDLLDRVRAGRSDALVLRGEPGIGKTALLEFARARADGCTVLCARGVVSEAELAFAGLHRLLRPVMDRMPALPRQQRASLASALELGAATERDRFLLSVAALSLLSEAAREQPVLACVDDAQWLDGPSLDALAFASRRLDTEGVAIVFAARDEGQTATCHHALEGIPVMALAELDDEAIGETLADSCDGPLGDDVRAALVRAAGGNPLAAVELVASLSAEQLAGAAPLPEPLPPSEQLCRAYAERIRRLPPDTRRLLVLLAADEDLDSVSFLLVARHAGIDVAALEAAEDAGLVRSDDDRVTFRHPLIRAASYRGATLAQRNEAHLLLARVFDETRHQRRKVWHQAATAARPDVPLANELEDVATRVRSRSGYATSSTFFERAAELTPTGPTQTARFHEAARDAWLAGHPKRSRELVDQARAATTTDELQGRTELLRGEIELRDGIAIDAHGALLAAAERLVTDHRELALRTFLQAGEASCLAGDHARYFATARRVAALRRPNEPARTRIIFDYFAGKSAAFQRNHEAAQRPLRRVQCDAEQLGDYDALIWGTVASHLLGDDVRAHKLAAQAVTVARRVGAVTVVPQALEFQLYSLFWSGRHPLAAATALEGLRLARETGQENCASHHLAALALISAIRGGEEDCERYAHAAADRATAHDLGLPAALSTWARAFLDLTHGRHAEAATRFRALACPGPGRGHVAIRMLATPHFVEAAVRTGDERRARAALVTFQRWGEVTGSPSTQALVARCQALLSAGPEAEERFTEALRLHRQTYRDFDRAHTELLFGGFLRRNRLPTLAREHLYSALETFQRLEARKWGERATAELRAAGEVVRPGERPALEELSPQQLQIARFVAQGATNREVAAQLFLSPRTVDHHLRNIFAKLGIRSRVELARLFG